MSEYATIEHYVNHVMGEITKRDVEQVSERLRALGWEEVVRCRDCKHATISSLGYVKYCEMFVLPDTDGYGADPQVNLPLDFFCGYGELRGDTE